MKCPQCGREIPIHQQYCAHCGRRVQIAFDVIAEGVVEEAKVARAKKLEQAVMPVVAVGVLANALIFSYNSLHTETPQAEPSFIQALPPAQIMLPRPRPPDPLTVAGHFDKKVWLDLPEFSPPPTRALPEKLEPLRSDLMRARGAGPGVAAAIERGVKFLKAAEAKGKPMGMVNPGAYGSRSPYFLVSGTALAALGILGNGECWLDGDEGIEGAVTWLAVKIQPQTGKVYPATLEATINQALSGLAVARAVRLSGDADLRKKVAPLFKALVKMQGEDGAWLKKDPRTRREVPDLWSTAVALLALREATRAGFEVPPGAFESARAYAASTMNRAVGLSGENVPKRLHRRVDITPFLEPTALAMACRAFSGEGPSPDVLRQLKYVLDNPPSADSRFGCARIYLVTAALQELFERVPDKWMKPAASYLVSRQQTDGSWPCTAPVEQQMSVICPTAFAVMTLQCYFGR